MIYIYFELPYWRMSIVTGMYLYFELPYWRMSIVTGMHLYFELPYWRVSIVTQVCTSILSYRTGGCLLSLVWQHSIIVSNMHYDCHMEAMSHIGH